MGLRDSATPVQNVEGDPINVTPGPSSSLAQLKSQLQAPPENVSSTPPTSNASSDGAAAPPPAASVPLLKGDALINQVNQNHAERTAEENRLIKLVTTSADIVTNRMQQDPGYAQTIAPQLENLKGSERRQFLIDQSDEFRIQQLKQQNPAIWNSVNAAVAGAVNTLTLGQDTRVNAALRTATAYLGDGGSTDYQQNLDDSIENFRLLQKAYPDANFLGKVAGYLIPDSVGAKVVNNAGKLTSQGINSGLNIVLKRAIRDPGLAERLVTAGGAGTVSGAANGLVRGTLGEGNQSVDGSRGIDEAGTQALWAGLTSLGVQGAGELGKGIASVAPKIANGVASGVEQLTGANKDALRAYNAQSANREFTKAAGTQRAIADDLVSYVYDYNEDKIEELKAAKKLLPDLPDVNVTSFIKSIRSVPAGNNPADQGAVKALQQWADNFESQVSGLKPNVTMRYVDPSAVSSEIIPERLSGAGAGTDAPVTTSANLAASGVPIENVSPYTLKTPVRSINGERQLFAPATLVEKWKRDLQTAASDAYGKEGTFYQESLKGIAANARASILKVAQDNVSGDVGKQYSTFMAQTATKMETLQDIRSFLGTNKEVATKKAVTFLNAMFGKNSDLIQRRMQDLDSQFSTDLADKFGSGFLERADQAKLATDLDPTGGTGKPTLFPIQTTGRSNLAFNVGKALTTLGGLGGIGSHGLEGGIIGAAGGATSFALASPKVGALAIGTSDKISGFLQDAFTKPELFDGIAAAKGFPPIVRQVAAKIGSTLQEEGPQSASGLVRLVADTPVFAAIVNAYEIMSRKQQTQAQKNLKPNQ